jgi:hypothetical protein
MYSLLGMQGDKLRIEAHQDKFMVVTFCWLLYWLLCLLLI